MTRLGPLVAAVAVGALTVGCGSDDEVSQPGDRNPVEPPAFVGDVRDAVAAVEAELGSGQEFFEVTANAQFTNVFVALEDATVVVPYLYVDGELQPPAPEQTGAEGNTFRAEDIRFEDELLLSGVSAELPDTSVDALSVYGDGVGAIYVLGASSEVGGLLDIVVGPTGAILSVDPL